MYYIYIIYIYIYYIHILSFMFRCHGKCWLPKTRNPRSLFSSAKRTLQLILISELRLPRVIIP